MIQRSVYLANADDLIYADTAHPGGEFAFVHKSGAKPARAYYIDYARVAAVQAAAPKDRLAAMTGMEQKRWFESLVANQAADADARALLTALGDLYSEQGGVLRPVVMNQYTLGLIVQNVVAHGAMYNPVGGGSRLPRAEGTLVHSNALSKQQVLDRISLSDDMLNSVNVQAVDPKDLNETFATLDHDPSHDLMQTARVGVPAGYDVIYASKVRQTRARNARFMCAGISCQEDMSNLQGDELTRVGQSFDTLPAVQASTDWIPGNRLVKVDRGDGQAAAMHKWNALGAAAFAKAKRGQAGLDLTQSWEWLHVQGAQIGGATTGGNLAAGLFATNSWMIPFENMVAKWAEVAADKFWARFDATPVQGLPGFARELRIGIRALEHPMLGTLDLPNFARFDPLKGQVVDKVAGEFIKRSMDGQARI